MSLPAPVVNNSVRHDAMSSDYSHDSDDCHSSDNSFQNNQQIFRRPEDLKMFIDTSSGYSRPKYRRIEAEMLSDSEKEKLNQRRERNKAAAARCRNRRRETITKLEKEAAEWRAKVEEVQADIEKLSKQRDQLDFLLQVHNTTCSLINHPLPSSSKEPPPPRAASANHVLHDVKPVTAAVSAATSSGLVQSTRAALHSSTDNLSQVRPASMLVSGGLDSLCSGRVVRASTAEGKSVNVLVLGSSTPTEPSSQSDFKPSTQSESRTNLTLPLITTPVTPPGEGGKGGVGANVLDTPTLAAAFLNDTPGSSTPGVSFTPSTPLFGTAGSHKSDLISTPIIESLFAANDDTTVKQEPKSPSS